MSFDVRPPGWAGATPIDDMTARIASERTAAPTRFARVYELEEARVRREHEIPPMVGDRIPDDVWDEVDAAARLFESLRADGRQMMFDTDRLTGKVVASLLEEDGSITPVALSDAVDPGVAAQQATPHAEGPGQVA
jgi:hypothetical protein